MPHTQNTVSSVAPRRPQSHLVNILKATRPHHPNFALFLGAGASVTSGVKASSKMIAEWEEAAWNMYGSGGAKDAYLKEQPWHNSPESYSILFEMLYDQPSQRREYIEGCLADARPSWGYIYLVNLLRERVFNTVFTTNFDDLLNEACYLFSTAVRPIVCAHDSSIQSVRVTSKRPKIIKLHGDFLFDNIKNTLGELESLEDNMRDKFKQHATEFGLIVVGYAGNDRSVMDALTVLLRYDSNFPHGVYWCVRKNSNINQNVENLRRFPKFKIIEIEGFDEMFADIQDALRLELQPEMADPYKALADRFNMLLSSVGLADGPTTNRVIEKDIKLLGEKFARFAPSAAAPLDVSGISDMSLKVGEQIVKIPLPFELLSQVELRQNHTEAAMGYLIRAIDHAPSPRLFMRALEILNRAPGSTFLSQFVQRLEAFQSYFNQNPDWTFEVALPLINMEEYDIANHVLDIGYRAAADNRTTRFENLYDINKLQIKMHQSTPFTESEMTRLKNFSQGPDKYISFGANILLAEFDKAEKLLQELIAKNELSVEAAEQWPIWKLFKRPTLFGPPSNPVINETNDRNGEVAS